MFHNLFLQIFYRPFLNALVLIYNLMPVYKDMGIALIIFVVLLRIVLLPLRKKAKASEPDQEKIMAEIAKAEEEYQYEPIKLMNLTFLQLFDMTVPNPALNAISAVGLFIVLFFHNWVKPQKATREDYIIMIWSPIAAFFITYRIPAGQEFFFTVSATIEFLLILNDQVVKWRKRLGFEKPLIDGKAFLKTAENQILGK